MQFIPLPNTATKNKLDNYFVKLAKSDFRTFFLRILPRAPWWRHCSGQSCRSLVLQEFWKILIGETRWIWNSFGSIRFRLVLKSFLNWIFINILFSKTNICIKIAKVMCSKSSEKFWSEKPDGFGIFLAVSGFAWWWNLFILNIH